MSIREQMEGYAQEVLGCTIDEPWNDKPGYSVLRHPLNGKWVGVLMPIPACSIGVGGDEIVQILNVKLEPALVAGLRSQEGYAPAWHMSKTHWLTIRLDGTVEPDRICALLEMSYELVAPKRRQKKE